MPTLTNCSPYCPYWPLHRRAVRMMALQFGREWCRTKGVGKPWSKYDIRSCLIYKRKPHVRNGRWRCGGLVSKGWHSGEGWYLSVISKAMKDGAGWIWVHHEKDLWVSQACIKVEAPSCTLNWTGAVEGFWTWLSKWSQIPSMLYPVLTQWTSSLLLFLCLPNWTTISLAKPIG